MTRQPTSKSERKYALHDLKFGRYDFLYFTGAFFAVSLLGHWIFGWFAYVNEQTLHGAQISLSDYSLEMLRDTLENW